MADETEDSDFDEEFESSEDGDSEGAGAKKRKLSGKVIVLYIALPILVLGLGGGGAALFLMGDEEHAEEEMAEEAPINYVYYDLPELLVNLNTSGNGTTYLKLQVSLEVTDPMALEKLGAMMPRVMDQFQVYLRELRLEDLNGSAGMFRLKQELLRRVNTAVEPVVVTDVLFKEMIVQ